MDLLDLRRSRVEWILCLEKVRGDQWHHPAALGRQGEEAELGNGAPAPAVSSRPLTAVQAAEGATCYLFIRDFTQSDTRGKTAPTAG